MAARPTPRSAAMSQADVPAPLEPAVPVVGRPIAATVAVGAAAMAVAVGAPGAGEVGVGAAARMGCQLGSPSLFPLLDRFVWLEPSVFIVYIWSLPSRSD